MPSKPCEFFNGEGYELKRTMGIISIINEKGLSEQEIQNFYHHTDCCHACDQELNRQFIMISHQPSAMKMYLN